MRQPLRKLKEALIYVFLLVCALISVLTMLGIITVLVGESVPFFRQVSIWSYLTGTRWSALLEPRTFGVLPLLVGTMQIAFGALAVAVPVGLGAAVYLSEYASTRVRTVVKPVLEILAGVPTVVYGYFALTFITPDILRRLFPNAEVFNAASAAIVVGIMIVPTIASLCDDALRAVPRSLREGAYALAANRLEVTVRVVLPGAFSGVVAAVLLALARALGETMAVTLAAGMTPKLTMNPLTSVQTLTSYIVQVSLGDTPHGTIEYQSIFAVALTLFLITLTINVVAQRMIGRFREEYE